MTDADDMLRRRALRRFRWSGLIIPLTAFALLAVVQVALLPQMPDPAATHWGFSGGPDGFGSAWTLPAMTLGVGGGLVVLFALLALSDLPVNGVGARGAGRKYKMVAAITWAEVGLVGVPMLGTFAVQVGLDDAHDAPATTWMLPVGAVVGAVLAFAAWRLNFAVPTEPSSGAEPAEIRLAPTERAVWIRSVSLARVAVAVLGVALLVTAGMALTTAILDLRLQGALSPVTWIVGACCLVVTAAVLLSATFEVRVDDAGLTVRGPLGWPRTHVERTDIRSVEVVQVSPMGEFGGWGWRYGVAGAGLGIVMRAGEAIRVTTTAGKRVTVTVDDAETGAALLRGLGADEEER